MNAPLFDRYSRVDGPVQRLPAALKLAVAVGLVVTTVILPIARAGYFVALAVGLLSVTAVSRIPPGFLVKRLLVLEAFVFGVALLAVWQPGGLRAAAAILIKSTLCLLTMLLLSNTTPFTDLLDVMRRVGVPALLVTTLALMYRYLFVLVEEAERMRRARSCRTFTRRRWPAWQHLASVLSQLFVRSTERAERIYAAMCARGWK